MTKVMRNIAAATALLMVALLGACSAGSSGSGSWFSSLDSGSAVARLDRLPGQPAWPGDPATVIEPTDGSTAVPPNTRIKVHIKRGTITEVVASAAGGGKVRGTLNANGKEWLAEQFLEPGKNYKVTVKVTPLGAAPIEKVSSFAVTEAADTFRVKSISPSNGETVGVGMPIVVRFNGEVIDRAAVQKQLKVQTTPPVEGEWRWDDGDTVQWRPRAYWPAHTKVKVFADIAGVQAAPNVWGAANDAREFAIGDAVVGTIDMQAFTLTLRRNNAVVNTIPITHGKRGHETRTGIKVVSTKERVHQMDAATLGVKPGDPDYYNIRAEYAMRLTNSGEFLHAAPWSQSQHGRSAASHGCTGMSMSNAAWLFSEVNIGDPMEYVGGSRPMEFGNGIGIWNMPFEEWVKGSAIPHQAPSSAVSPNIAGKPAAPTATKTP